MRLALDLDGPCYDFHRTFRYMMREHRGVVMPAIDEFWTAWDSQTKFGTPEDHEWMWNVGAKVGLFRFGHMITGCRIGLEALAEKGHTFFIVTHRPADARDDTWDWVNLYFNGLPLDGLLLMSNGGDKSIVDADVLIDDKNENVWDWASSGRQALLWNGAWNQDCPVRTDGLIKRVYSWKEIVDAL